MNNEKERVDNSSAVGVDYWLDWVRQVKMRLRMYRVWMRRWRKKNRESIRLERILRFKSIARRQGPKRVVTAACALRLVRPELETRD